MWWDRPPNADPELVALWDQVERHVLEHELQHQRINEEMLSVFRRSISAIEPQPTVGELADRIEAVRTKIAKDYVSEHALFHRVDRMWKESIELLKDD